MGQVVGAGLLAHVPTIMLPEEIRRELNNGEDTTLVAGLRQLRRDVFETLDYDTVVVLDSHWATTVEFVVTAQQRRSGLFTSEELPRGMSPAAVRLPRRPRAGAPDRLQGRRPRHVDHRRSTTTICRSSTPPPTCGSSSAQGLPDKRWISIGVCQTADTEDNLRLGRALGDAIAESRPQGRADRLRRALPHVLAAARSSATTRRPASSTSSPPKPPRRTPSGWSGSRPATTPGYWTPCPSSTGTGRRPGSATT